jgi:hypothetical protein
VLQDLPRNAVRVLDREPFDLGLTALLRIESHKGVVLDEEYLHIENVVNLLQTSADGVVEIEERRIRGVLLHGR